LRSPEPRGCTNQNAEVGPNLNDCFRLLHGISCVWHHAANEILAELLAVSEIHNLTVSES
jgi:hypothetical protein